jgi:ectoine hydroxylase-related dioxygenase (phytanoyl-CoA dioxygenase family)
MLVANTDREQFRDEGYFVLEGAIPAATLAALRKECQKLLDEQMMLMDRVGTDTLGLSHRNKRYSLPCRHEENPEIEQFLFGETMQGIVGSALGSEAYLFLELFNVKWPATGIPFSWHQDSGYLMDLPHKPYVSLWCALDDMTEANGALRVLPFSQSGTRDLKPHTKDKATNDYVGYSGDECGVPMLISASSVVVFSSLTFHCSGPNTSDKPRRAFLASYTPEPIRQKTGQLWDLAVPFIKDGVNVAQSTPRLN